MKHLGDFRLFMLDMDGTFYLEDTLLPGAQRFLDVCARRGIGVMFVTNNSSKSGRDYIKKLAGMGVQVAPQQMMTSGDATLEYLAEQQTGKELLLVGTPSLVADFEAAGYSTRSARPAAVVLGFDTTLDYEKLCLLCNAVRSGLPYIATHPDVNCPVKGGYIPDIGATIAYVQAATGRLPDVVVGKPNALMAKAAARRAQLPPDALCMVGDRLYTDIAMGQNGIATALVLSGETNRQMLEQSGMRPDFVFEGLLQMAERLAEE